MNSQTTLPAVAGGFANLSVPIPAGSCAARLQPTLSDADWTAGKELTCSVVATIGGQPVVALNDWRLQTGALQSDPSNPQPAYCEIDAPLNADGSRTAWTMDAALVSVSAPAGVMVGAIVSFADSPDNLPAPVAPPA